MKLITTAALTLLLALSMLAPATAGVERYQFTTYDLAVTSVNGNTTYSHSYTLTHNPCDDSWAGSGWSDAHQWSEEISVVSFDPTTPRLAFRADYPHPSEYHFFPQFDLNADGTLAFVDGYGVDNVTAMTGNWSSSQTQYNHGEYVAEDKDDYGDGAHSCIGKPVASNDNASR